MITIEWPRDGHLRGFGFGSPPDPPQGSQQPTKRMPKRSKTAHSDDLRVHTRRNHKLTCQPTHKLTSQSTIIMQLNALPFKQASNQAINQRVHPPSRQQTLTPDNPTPFSPIHHFQPSQPVLPSHSPTPIYPSLGVSIWVHACLHMSIMHPCLQTCLAMFKKTDTAACRKHVYHVCRV